MYHPKTHPPAKTKPTSFPLLHPAGEKGLWGAEGGSGLPEEICGSWHCHLRPRDQLPSVTAPGWGGLGAPGLGPRGQGRVEQREGPSCRPSTAWAPHQPSQLFGAAEADGAVAAAVPVLSPLPADTGPGATNQKSKLKILKLSTLQLFLSCGSTIAGALLKNMECSAGTSTEHTPHSLGTPWTLQNVPDCPLTQLDLQSHPGEDKGLGKRSA